MDPPLAKAKPISNSGSASGITYLRKGKKSYRGVAVAARESGVRRCERNKSADTKVSEEGGGGGAPGAGAGGCPKEAVTPWEARAGAGS